MKKALYIFALFTLLVGLFITSSSASAVGNVDDFQIQDFQVDYYLGRNSEGHSTLKTTEFISAVFPEIDQNRGIERAIPHVYDGHSTRLSIESVVDSEGKPRPYTTRTENNNTILRIGEESVFVHGLQTYKITYTQQDVTKFYGDTNADEFYWDTNGTEWRVPFQSVTARLHIDPALSASLSGEAHCYYGLAGSTTKCELTPTDDGYTATVKNLNPYENMSLAVGFKPLTFTAYQTSSAEKASRIWFFLFAVTTAAAAIVGGSFLWRYNRASYRINERRTVIPEYLPPPDISVSTAGTIINHPSKIFAAQLIDLAVRHYIKIYQTREKSWFRSAKYELEIIRDISTLKPEEKEILNDIFANPYVGARLDLSSLRNNFSIRAKLDDNPEKLDANIAGAYQLRARDEAQSGWFKRIGKILVIIGVLTLSIPLIMLGIVGFVLSSKLKPLTDKGLDLYHYLEGLKMYIKVAETERLRMLQSPEGALKVGAEGDPDDPRQLVKLYERVLPYAILFGQEKDWNNRLGQYYEKTGQQPDWFNNNSGVVTAAALGSALNSFSSAASYSNPSSSSSGGSSGGGSSGGGGGGGGGGGW